MTGNSYTARKVSKHGVFLVSITSTYKKANNNFQKKNMTGKNIMKDKEVV